jgi:purine-binding chemotaxis protein CheW
VEGVIKLRGRIIPVLNLRRRLGSVGERRENGRFVVETGDVTLGMEVDGVSEVLTVDVADCEPLARGAAVARSGLATEVIDSIVKLEGRLPVILDLDRLMGSDGPQGTGRG